jgi:hypothetical protein
MNSEPLIRSGAFLIICAWIESFSQTAKRSVLKHFYAAIEARRFCR